MRIYILFCLFLFSFPLGAQKAFPFNNPNLSVEERVDSPGESIIDVRLFITNSSFRHRAV